MASTAGAGVDRPATPLGIEHRPEPDGRRIVLDQLATRRGATRPGLLDGLNLTATDTEWTHGDGAPVSGTTSALITTVTGRSAALDELAGTGVSLLRDRLTPRAR